MKAMYANSRSGLLTAAPYVSEFVGTYLLVVTFGCVVLGAPAEWGPTAIGCAIMVSVYACSRISGGSLNPAVSIALLLVGKKGFKEVACYCLVQATAGLLGGLTFFALFGQGFYIGPKPRFSLSSVAALETLYTALLCFVVLSCTVSRKNNPEDDQNQSFGLAIGFSYIAAGYSAGNVSGALLNPAVTLGVYTAGGNVNLGGMLASYIAFQVAGAILAAVLFRLMNADEFRGVDQVPEDDLALRAIAELVGAFVLALTASLNILGESPVVPWSVAAALMCLVYSLGSVSGGHFNPAVTGAVVFSGRGKLSPNEGLAYIGAQLCGGLAGSSLASMTHRGAPLGLTPSVDFNWVSVGFVEAVFTGVVALVVLSVATVEPVEGEMSLSRQPFHTGLAIGLSITAGGFAVQDISGGILNPAIAFGLSSMDTTSMRRFMYFSFYFISEMFGGALAALVLFLTRPGEYPELPLKQ